MVSDNYYPDVGGIAEHVHHLAVELRRRGHEVRILTSNFGNRRGEVPDPEHIHRVGKAVLLPSNQSFARIPTAWRPTRQIARYFARHRFDIVHIHGSLAPSLPIVSLRASHAINVFTFHAEFGHSLPYIVLKPLLDPYFRMIHGLVAVSESARDSTARYFPGDYRIIPNAIATDFFRPDAEPMPGLDDGRPSILFLGRIEPRKGLKYLLQALPQVVRRFPDARLVVVGAAPFGNRYEDCLDPDVAGHVLWTGAVPGEDRPRYYASCDVYCSPAIGRESFGIVLLEAMACARPVVASRIRGYRRVVEHDTDGLLVPPCDPDAIARAVCELLEDPARRERMGRAGREKALAYAWPGVAARVEEYYRELLARYPVPRCGR
ncbi:glycosyltransferase family 4 protein [candidate division WOR-3 bacterium]|nr:glycosyltransferase family 4 protein [candidate division WOR-3 bacterium]